MYIATVEWQVAGLELPNTASGNDVLALAQRGDVGGMSFGFTVRDNGESWDGNGRIGRAVLSRAAESMKSIQNANIFASSFMQNSAQPSGVLSAPALSARKLRSG